MPTHPSILKRQLEEKICQLDAVLTAGAERVPTELGPVQYNLVEAGKERARLMAELSRLERNTRATRMIRVWPTRS